MKVGKRIAFVALAVSLPIQVGCHLKAKRTENFAALTTPVSYHAPVEVDKQPPTGFVGKVQVTAKNAAKVVGKGVLLSGGLIAWMWLDSDDETIIDRQYRKRNEGRWKNAWRDNPDINPAMTAAFKDDHE